MDLNQFIELTDALDLIGLSKAQIQEKRIQIADLLQFIKCQEKEAEIINCFDYIAFIVRIGNERKGITFFDIDNVKKRYYTSRFILKNESELIHLKNVMQIEDLWFVFVHESQEVESAHLCDFITQYSLKSLYHKIALFDYHQLTVKELI
ncbi:MAG: hypothetical protein LBT43_15835 [Prevotella sp.]|jgi:hypothetical protein|nr:hypothetical protein [Prevotella sp.]